MSFVSPLRRGGLLVAALVLTPVSVASGATGESAHLHLGSTTATSASSSGGPSIMHTILALVIVIALIYVVARVLKAVKGRDQRASGDGLKHLATLPLGQNKSLALVRSGSDIVLVGISESGVSPIKSYTEAEAIANGIIPDDGDGFDAASPAAGADRRGRRDEAEPTFGWLEGLRRMTVRS